MKTLLTTTALVLAAATAQAQELTVAAANLSDYLEPGTDHSNVGSQFYTNIFETLIAKDPNAASNVFGPGLAVSYELLSDNLIELKIREGVKFHNGDDMTVEDVLFSLQAMIKVMHDARIERSKEFFGNITRAEAIDDTTIRVYAKKPEPLMELILAAQQSMILPKNYLMGLTGRPDVDESSDYIAFGLAPVGTGPYKVAEFTPETRIVYERFDDYWGETAPYERVTVRKIAELAPRITALVNGEVDLITNVPPDQLDVINNNPDYKTVGGVTPLFHIVYFGPEGDIVTPELRQAMVKAVDRNLLNEALWLGQAVVPNTHTYPNYGDFYTPDIMTFEYDPEGAAKLVADNDLAGTTIPFITHPTYYTNGLLAATAMQEMWRELDINVELQVSESWAGWGSKDTMANWSNPMYFADPHGSFGKMWAPEGAGMTRGFWTPSIGMEEWGKMYDAFRFETDVATRNARFEDLMEVVKNDAPFLVLYQPYESWGMRADLDWAPYPGHIPYVLDFRAGYIGDAKHGITK